MAQPVYSVLALKYATRDARRADHFLDGAKDDPDRPMPMDYFVWVISNEERTLLLDTGFKPEVGARRGRTPLRSPAEALRLAGFDPDAIEDIIISHLHYDHAGTIDAFPRARLHLQASELAFVTSRENERMRRSFEVDDIVEVVRRLYGERLCLYDGSAAPWPGITLHLIGGHTGGNQAVRVSTARGGVVLASDASHYYENMETGRPFVSTHDVDRTIAGYRTLYGLADSPDHVIPGHDPQVLRRYPAASPELAGIAARLDLPPVPLS